MNWIAPIASAYLVGFYYAFVAQHMWNWFGVKAFGVPPISYWEAVGLTMLLTILIPKPGNIVNEKRDAAVIKLLELCIPNGKIANAEEIVKSVKASNLVPEILGTLIGSFFGGTLTLIFGWIIFHFFVSTT